MTKPSMIDSFSGVNSFLSNFFPVEVEYERIVYRTVEHAYQAAKSLDSRIRAEIAAITTAGAAKKRGQSVPARKDWEQVKLGVMEELLREKFRNVALKTLLIGTGDRELVEGNWWGDVFWGVCKGRGENHLGRLLMKIRSELK
jgi:ribA/ribD-fused uncharacterized protein